MDDPKGVTLDVGLQLVCYPLSADIVLDDLDLANDGATGDGNYVNADQIFTWEGSAYQRYALYDVDSKWYGCNTLQEWEDGSVLGSDRVLKVGEGFWYKAKATVNWDEDNPYLANL
jgi:hypothetical protein